MIERSLTLLNEMGHLVVTWDAAKDKEMEQIIQKKLDAGVRFFIVAPFSGEEIPVNSLKDVTSRTINIPDDDIAKMFTDGKVGIVSRLTNMIDTIRPSTKATEIATNHSVGMKQFAGG